MAPPAAPVPAYYPGALVTPFLELSLIGMNDDLAENFVTLDTLASGTVFSFMGRTGIVTAQTNDYSFNNIAGELSLGQIPTGGDDTTFLRGDGSWASPVVDFTDITGVLALGQIPAGGGPTTFLRGDGSWAVPGGGPASSLILSPVNLLAGGTDVIDPHTAATYMVTNAGVNAMTLAAPTVTTDDGKVIKVTLSTNAAHTITCTGGTLRPGTAAVTTVNFASFRGASIELMAWQGNWYVMAQNNIASFT